MQFHPGKFEVAETNSCVKLLVAMVCINARDGSGLSLSVGLGHRADKDQSRAAKAKGQHEGAGCQGEQVRLGGSRPFTRPQLHFLHATCLPFLSK